VAASHTGAIGDLVAIFKDFPRLRGSSLKLGTGTNANRLSAANSYPPELESRARQCAIRQMQFLPRLKRPGP
jgi:hypothetical protein